MSTTETNGVHHPTFALERFAWDAPDRLEVSGWFSGLRGAPAEAPVLVVRGSERTHRLPAAATGSPSPPEDGQRWWAAFTWQEMPEAFQGAELELGGDLSVQLPEPRPDRQAFGDRVLVVRGAVAQAPEAPEPPESRPAPSAAAERLRLEAQLLTAQEETRELRAAVERSGEELARARADLEAERERRAADAVRFHEGLEHVQTSAEQALAADHAATERAQEELRAARAEIQALQARLVEVRRPTKEALAEAERLVGRLSAIEGALKPGRPAP